MTHEHAHTYTVEVTWTGNLGAGTSGYRTYSRDHEVKVEGKPTLLGSSDPAFRGNAVRHNPEDLLMASLSACHMLWYLHLCADAGVVVTGYSDAATGTMQLRPDGGGQFTEVVLHPQVTLAPGSNPKTTKGLHERAHQLCFIASSVNFPVRVEPVVRIEND